MLCYTRLKYSFTADHLPWHSPRASSMFSELLVQAQVQNKRCQAATRLHPFERGSCYTDDDVQTLVDLAGMLEDTRSHCEALLALRDTGNPLSRVPFSEHAEDAHTKIQYMLKDALGVLNARVLEVDHVNDQLVVSGECSSSHYPLTAASIAATVVKTGKLRHLHHPFSAPDFNRHIDGGGGVGVVEDLLVVPVMAAIGSSCDGKDMGEGVCRLDRPAHTGAPARGPRALVIAVCQVGYSSAPGLKDMVMVSEPVQ